MVAGLAGMQALDQAAYEHLESMGQRMRQQCQTSIDEAGAPMQVSGIGAMFSIYFHQRNAVDYRSYYKSAAENAATERFHQVMMQQGVLIAPTATCFLSTAVTSADEDQFAQAFKRAVQDFVNSL